MKSSFFAELTSRVKKIYICIPTFKCIFEGGTGKYTFYATETYVTHFLEDARFPKALGFSEALSNLLLYALAKSADRVPPPPGWGPWSVRALKQPLCSHLYKNTNQTVEYMALGFMIFMRGFDITWGIGRVLLKVEPVFGPEIARA